MLNQYITTKIWWCISVISQNPSGINSIFCTLFKKILFIHVYNLLLKLFLYMWEWKFCKLIFITQWMISLIIYLYVYTVICKIFHLVTLQFSFTFWVDRDLHNHYFDLLRINCIHINNDHFFNVFPTKLEIMKSMKTIGFYFIHFMIFKIPTAFHIMVDDFFFTLMWLFSTGHIDWLKC